METDPFSGQLLSGERIQWRGAPGQGWQFSARDILLIPFGLVWCAFIGSAFIGGLASPPRAVPVDLIFILIPGGMLCVGLFFLFGRFPIDAWLRGRTRYAVTNQRILIARDAPFGSFTAVSLDRIPTVKFDQRSDGSGTLRFGESVSMFSNRGFSTFLPSLDPTPQFITVDNAKSVFDLIQRLSHKPA